MLTVPQRRLRTQLVCPNCQEAMRTYERNRVDIDQCTDCRGAFRDRGELERLLLDAESAHYDKRALPMAVPRSDYERESGQAVYHGSQRATRAPGSPERRKNFLGKLFD